MGTARQYDIVAVFALPESLTEAYKEVRLNAMHVAKQGEKRVVHRFS